MNMLDFQVLLCAIYLCLLVRSLRRQMSSRTADPSIFDAMMSLGKGAGSMLAKLCNIAWEVRLVLPVA